MGALYAPEIFVLSEKRILSLAFHDGDCVPSSGFSPAAAPTRKTPVRNLCHIPVWHRIRLMRSFAMCRLLLGRKAACTSRMSNGLRRVEDTLNRGARKALDDEMRGNFLAAHANSI